MRTHFHLESKYDDERSWSLIPGIHIPDEVEAARVHEFVRRLMPYTDWRIAPAENCVEEGNWLGRLDNLLDTNIFKS